VGASVGALCASLRAWAVATKASYPWATSEVLWLRNSHVSTRAGAFEGRLPVAAVLRAPLGRRQRSVARSRPSVALAWHVVTRATATCSARRPESLVAPRKRSGTTAGEDVFERRRVDEHAGHAAAEPITRARTTHGLDRTRKCGL